MNSFDFFIVCVVFFTAALGAWRGCIKEIASIMAWVLAGVATFWDIPMLRTFMLDRCKTPFVAELLAGVVVFVIAFIIISLIGSICSNFIKKTLISPVDRIFGSVVGAGKGVFLFCCIEMLSLCFIARNETPQLIKNSTLIDFIYEGSDLIRSFLPEKIRNYIDDFTKKHNLNFETGEGITNEETKSEAKENSEIREIGEPKTKTDSSAEDAVYTVQQNNKLNMLIDEEKNKSEEAKDIKPEQNEQQETTTQQQEEKTEQPAPAEQQPQEKTQSAESQDATAEQPQEKTQSAESQDATAEQLQQEETSDE